jgi:tetratricopeptide (TPR) repeat protein
LTFMNWRRPRRSCSRTSGRRRTRCRIWASAQWRLGRNADAAINLERALAIALTVDDVTAEGGIRNSLGLVHEQLGNLEDAARHLTRATRIASSYGDPVGEAAALSNLSRTYRQFGRMDEAEEFLIRAADLADRGRSQRRRPGAREPRVHPLPARRLRRGVPAAATGAGDHRVGR